MNVTIILTSVAAVFAIIGFIFACWGFLKMRYIEDDVSRLFSMICYIQSIEDKTTDILNMIVDEEKSLREIYSKISEAEDDSK